MHAKEARYSSHLGQEDGPNTEVRSGVYGDDDGHFSRGHVVQEKLCKRASEVAKYKPSIAPHEKRDENSHELLLYYTCPAVPIVNSVSYSAGDDLHPKTL